MKKLLIILAVGLSLSANSQQVNPTGTVMTLSVFQPSICQCDSVEFSFVFRDVAIQPPPQDFFIWAKNLNTHVLIHTFDYTDIKLMPTSPVGNFYQDTIYFSKMLIPCNLLSKLGVGFDFSTGITFKDGLSDNLFVKDCLTGVEEYSEDEKVVKYYNFSGQVVEPKQGELLIKQVGNKRIKVLIQ
jgi:hypothetical protein